MVQVQQDLQFGRVFSQGRPQPVPDKKALEKALNLDTGYDKVLQGAVGESHFGALNTC